MMFMDRRTVSIILGTNVLNLTIKSIDKEWARVRNSRKD